MKKYTIQEIKNYLSSVDSLGDALYYCSERSIDEANEVIPNTHTENEEVLESELDKSFMTGSGDCFCEDY